MLRVLRSVLVFAVLGALAPAAQAGLAKGDKEIGVFGQISSPDDGDASVLLGGNFGKMFTNWLQFKADVSVVESGDFFAIFGGAGLDFLFGAGKTRKFIPYAGGLLNLTLIDITSEDPITGDETSSTGEGVTVEVHAGFKIFLSERTALNLELQRRIGEVTIEDDSGGESESDQASTDLVLGINFYF